MKNNVFEHVDLSVAPMARADVEERLDSLHKIDEVNLASTAIATLRAGKISKGPTTQREFSEATAAYYTELERTSVALRREIRLLNDVSGDKVMPVNVVPKATAVGRQKEEAIWLSISEEKKGSSGKEEEEQEQEQEQEKEKKEEQEDQVEGKGEKEKQEKQEKNGDDGDVEMTDKSSKNDVVDVVDKSTDKIIKDLRDTSGATATTTAEDSIEEAVEAATGVVTDERKLGKLRLITK
ncbi:uncharacterized protein SAPINGB_P000443 [Magnusiomyces paraingens]|uniref:Mediator of RNA polymerase II transcription subunit 11 n=1 Tax=Magnusiomyces paraingens TaxID=2606893 RepID=A0A5E8AZZ0_9ASCO|nr:uncharacterized protein SAPINGB_P000443 [Saprochaete ingens]VVT44518.1 unnamed protein product [Saprochaete ingens]